ncbi:MAG: hypothetical protein P8O76_02070 [Methylophilaceae bacterium]|nr:hypothetical protein [Methylophilaceae bacterium]
MRKQLGVLAVLLFNYSHVMATEWTSIIQDAEHKVFVDIDSYNVSNQLPYLVAKTIYKQPQSFVSANKTIKYAISIATLQYNCEKPLYRMLAIQLLDKKSKPIKTFKINAHLKKIVSNSDTFSIGQLTCQVHQMLGGASAQ